MGVEALDNQIQKYQDTEARKRMWKEMLRSEPWMELVSHLEDIYIEASRMPCDSLVKLARRNERMSLIRDIFMYVKHDFISSDLELIKLRELQNMEDELPTPYDPYGFEAGRGQSPG